MQHRLLAECYSLAKPPTESTLGSSKEQWVQELEKRAASWGAKPDHPYFVSEDESLLAGVWEYAPSTLEFDSYPVHELMTVLS